MPLLDDLHGPDWYIKNVPGDVVDKCKNAKAYEARTPWVNNVPHHPIYYTDFPDLAVIITRKDNWCVFQDIFHRSDVLKGLLTQAEPLRNKLAHNRKLSNDDLHILESIYTELVNYLGSDRVEELAGRRTEADDIRTILTTLATDIDDIYKEICDYREICIPKNWDSIKNSWWFNEHYLNSSIEAVSAFLEVVLQYASIERRKGSIVEIEAWVLENEIEQLFREAINELEVLLDQGGLD